MLSQNVSRPEAPDSQLTHMVATAQAYQQFYGWPTRVDQTSGQVVLTISTGVDAVVSPVEQGREALSLLSVRMLSGPVVALPGDSDWVFLTGPACALSMTTLADLGRFGVRLKGQGSTVPLPPSQLDDDVVRWASGPKGTRQLPPWTAVIGAIRAVCSAQPKKG